jgi:hypothetical protein
MITPGFIPGLAFCRVSTEILYFRAIDVKVSPLRTVWAAPIALGVAIAAKRRAMVRPGVLQSCGYFMRKHI